MNKLLLKFFVICVFISGGSFSFGQTILLNENFSSGSMPAGWSQDSAGVTPFYLWTFNNPGSRVITGASFDSQFAIFDSDLDSEDISEDTYLNLPSVNASALATVFLVMDEQYRDYTNGYHQVEISNNGGVSWTGIVSDTDSTSLGFPNPAVRSIYDITTWAAGHADVRIRFHYAATWGWWWAIDNVIITSQAPACISPPSAGTIESDYQVACGTNSFTLNLHEYTTGTGQTYQWQNSSDGTNWSNLPGATMVPYTTNQVTSMFYRCIVTCSSMPDTSDALLINNFPDPENTIASDVFPCAAPQEDFTLSLSVNTPSAGLTYQWQLSSDNVTFNDIGGATSSTLTTSQSVVTYYRCELVCGGSSFHSLSRLVNINPTTGCYCYPFNPVCTGNEITEVTFNTLSNTSTCNGSNIYSNYTFYPSSTVTTIVNAGMAYNLNVTTDTNSIISVWIDYNRDGVYDTSEWSQVCLISTGGVANSISITIPDSAYNGLTGMRIRSRDAFGQNDSSSSCLVMGSGETEDYEITIQNGVDAVQSKVFSAPKIYPSPTRGLVYVDFEKPMPGTRISILDAWGRTVLVKRSSNSPREFIDISGFADGLYFIKIENENGMSAHKVMLNK